MAEIVHPISKPALEKGDKRQECSEDRISKFPEDILVFILSLLTIRDAARTCVLSHRWKYLWTFINGSLEFDKSIMGNGMLARADHESEVKRRFLDWVNQVLRSHQAPTLDGFKVCFDMNYFNSCVINGWLNIAMEKRIKCLELDFTSASRGYKMYPNNYRLTPQLFCSSQFDSLTSLRLNCVEVTAETVEHLLSNCPFLQVLCLANSNSMLNLKISGPSLKLKYLEISRCLFIKSIEVSAINLVSFIYYGHAISMPLMSAPHLRELSFGGVGVSFLFDDFCKFSSCTSQLENLELDFSTTPFVLFPEFPALKNLKQLKLVLDASQHQSLLHCTSLLEACPLLNRLVLKFSGLDASKQEKVEERKAKHPHQCLKVVELVGFVGCKIDLELAMYLLKNCLLLEKIIIVPRSPIKKESSRNHPTGACELDVGASTRTSRNRKASTQNSAGVVSDTEEIFAVKTRARQLAKILPPGTKLVIL